MLDCQQTQSQAVAPITANVSKAQIVSTISSSNSLRPGRRPGTRAYEQARSESARNTMWPLEIYIFENLVHKIFHKSSVLFLGKMSSRVHSMAQFSESSDVYSFGVFLLELITGREAALLVSPESRESLAHWMEAHFSSNELIDPRLGGSFTSEGMKEFVGLTFQCLNPSSRRRPKMRLVATELDRILEMEMSLTTIMGDGTTSITLGSQLFTS